MVREALADLDEVMKAGGELVKAVRFADDKAFIIRTEEGFQRMVDSLVEIASVF